MNKENPLIKPGDIECIVFDFGFTLSSDLFFKITPPECPDWQELIQAHIFRNKDLIDDWMSGAVTLDDIATKLMPLVDMDVPRIVEFLNLGCKDLNFNEAVLAFALAQREQGLKTAIVTNNMDVFTEIVVPHHSLKDKFDIIINSCDYKEIDKSVLWAKAFKLLGNGIGYNQSLLIEDGENNVKKFRENGGYAYQYTDDECFLNWLKLIGWQ